MRCWLAAVTVAGCLAISGAPVRAQMPDDLRVGYQAYRAGQFQQAAEAFGRAIELGNLDRDAMAVTLNNRGVAYSQLGNYDAAIADYQEAQRLKADDPTTIRNLRFAYVTRGLASANQGNRPAALQDYDRALEMDPNYLEALQYRGALLVEMGSNSDAANDFRRVLTLEPNNPAAIAALGALDGQPATTPPAPVAEAPVDAAVPLAAEGSAPDSVQAAVARSQAAQDRAQAALDDALAAARDVEPTAAPEVPAAPSTQPEVEIPAPAMADEPVAAAPQPPAAPEPATPAPAAPEPAPPLPAPPEPAPEIAADLPAPPTPVPAPRVTEEPAPTPPPPPAPTVRQEAVPSGDRYRVTSSVNLRGGPGNSFGIIGSLEPGTIVTPDAEDKGWYRIPRDGAGAGWVYRRFLDPQQ